MMRSLVGPLTALGGGGSLGSSREAEATAGTAGFGVVTAGFRVVTAGFGAGTDAGDGVLPVAVAGLGWLGIAAGVPLAFGAIR